MGFFFFYQDLNVYLSLQKTENPEPIVFPVIIIIAAHAFGSKVKITKFHD